MAATVKEIFVAGYEKVIEARDEQANLHCFIAVHNSSLGPALGGTRIFPYANRELALDDALRLAKSMTYKSAICEDGLGGGKAVVIANSKTEKNEALLLAFGEVVNSLKGLYIAAEDVGTTTEDMLVIKKKTSYVAALPLEKSSGDPSRFTAWGVFKGIQAVAQTLWHSHSLQGKVVAIQGLGNVGSKLAHILFWEGAELLISDLDEQKMASLALLYGAKTAHPKEIASMPCDIYAPCSMGGCINEQSLPLLQCQAVAGAANNQLLHPHLGLLLQERNILYAPDYVINAGGIINAAGEFLPEGYDPQLARDKVNRIYDVLLMMFEESRQTCKPTSQIADELAEYKLAHGIGKRDFPLRL